jgi:hypothetical protein
MADGGGGGLFMMLRPIIQRTIAGRELPPEQLNQMTRGRYMCEKVTSLIVVFLFCITLLTVGVIKIEQVQEILFAGNQSILEKILCKVKSITSRLEQQSANFLPEDAINNISSQLF